MQRRHLFVGQQPRAPLKSMAVRLTQSAAPPTSSPLHGGVNRSGLRRVSPVAISSFSSCHHRRLFSDTGAPAAEVQQRLTTLEGSVTKTQTALVHLVKKSSATQSTLESITAKIDAIDQRAKEGSAAVVGRNTDAAAHAEDQNTPLTQNKNDIQDASKSAVQDAAGLIEKLDAALQRIAALEAFATTSTDVTTKGATSSDATTNDASATANATIKSSSETPAPAPAALPPLPGGFAVTRLQWSDLQGRLAVLEATVAKNQEENNILRHRVAALARTVSTNHTSVAATDASSNNADSTQDPLNVDEDISSTTTSSSSSTNSTDAVASAKPAENEGDDEVDDAFSMLASTKNVPTLEVDVDGEARMTTARVEVQFVNEYASVSLAPIRRHMESAGTVMSCLVRRVSAAGAPSTGGPGRKARGAAPSSGGSVRRTVLVTYDSVYDAARAVENLDRSFVEGQELRVVPAMNADTKVRAEASSV